MATYLDQDTYNSMHADDVAAGLQQHFMGALQDGRVEDAPVGSDSLTNPTLQSVPSAVDNAVPPQPAPLEPAPQNPTGLIGDTTGLAPLPPSAPAMPSAPSAPGYQSALDWGMSQIGKGYIWGSAGGRTDLTGNAPGFDCSGFVSQFYHQMGRSVPAQTASAYAATTAISQADAKPGDIVEFNMNSNDPHEQHIAIYLGNGKILQSGGTRHDVNVGNVNQFGPGTFEFRRAAGGDTTTDSTTARASVATVAKPAAAAPSVVDDLRQHFDDALNKGRDTAKATVQSTQDVLDGLRQHFMDALNPPDLGAGLASPSYANSPVAQQAAGNRPNPFDVKDQASSGLANTLLPNVPIATGALAGALDPTFLPGGAVAAPIQLAADAAAPLVKAGARAVAGAVGEHLPQIADAAGQLLTSRAQGQVNLNAIPDAAKGVLGAINDLSNPAANTIKPVQSAISDFANVAGVQAKAARVDAENLAMRAKQVLGKDDTDPALIAQFEKTGQFYANPTPEQSSLADDLRKFFQDTGDKGRASGYINGDVTNTPGGPAQYFPHLYEDPATNAAAKSGSFNPNDFYSKPRDLLTIEDAMAAGKTPTPISDAVQTYAEHALSSGAKADFVEALKTAGPDAVVPYVPGAKLPDGFRPGGSIDNQFNGIALSPATYRAVKNVISESGIRTPTIGSAVMATMQEGKRTLFSLSNFHTLTEATNALFANGLKGPGVVGKMMHAFVSPAAFDAARSSPEGMDLFSRAAHDGVTGLSAPVGDVASGVDRLGTKGAYAVRTAVGGATGFSGGYSTAKATGASDEDAIKAGLATGAVTAAIGPKATTLISDGLWKRAVPIAKALTYEIQTKAGADGKAAADFVNNTFGGQNLTAMARGRTMQDVSRLMVLAPDWTESTWRTAQNLVAPNQTGTMTRNYVLTQLAGIGFLTEALNVAFTGHTTADNPPGKQFQVQLAADAKDKRGLPDENYLSLFSGNLQQLLDLASKRDIKGYVENRMAPLPRAAVDAVSNKDFAGNDIIPAGATAAEGLGKYGVYEAGRFAPVGVSNVGNELNRGAPLPAALASTLTGVKLSHQTGTSVLMQQRNDLDAAGWPGVETKLRATPEFQSANPARQAEILSSQHTQYTADLSTKVGLPPVDTGLPPKYMGVSDGLMQRQIDAAITKMNAWDANPRTAPRPTSEEMSLARRYDGRISPAYTRATQSRTQQNQALTRVTRSAP